MKKRTAKMFYGKREQRMEAMATRAFELGDREFGEALIGMISQSLREAKPRIRKPAPWIPHLAGYRFEAGVRVRR
jgi:hypothetical protein